MRNPHPPGTWESADWHAARARRYSRIAAWAWAASAVCFAASAVFHILGV